MAQEKSDILIVAEKLSYCLEKVEEIDPLEADIDEDIVKNRIITLRGYLRYLDQDGIDVLKKIQSRIEGAENG